MEKTYLIYKFTSPSGKSYIGQTCNLKKRKSAHRNSEGCRVFHSAIKKYNGLEYFIEEILEYGLTLEEANIKEELYIVEHNTRVPYGYNLQSGGFNNLHSNESIQKQKETMKGRYIGEDNPFYGKTHTEEAKKNNRLAHLGNLHSEDTLIKLREINGGENNSQYGKFGEDHPAFGYKHTPDHIAKISGENAINFGKFGELHHCAKKYIITYPDGSEEFVTGLNEFCRVNDITSTNMSRVAKGKRTHHKGFKCRYATQEEIDLWN